MESLAPLTTAFCQLVDDTAFTKATQNSQGKLGPWIKGRLSVLAWAVAPGGRGWRRLRPAWSGVETERAPFPLLVRGGGQTGKMSSRSVKDHVTMCMPANSQGSLHSGFGWKLSDSKPKKYFWDKWPRTFLHIPRNQPRPYLVIFWTYVLRSLGAVWSVRWKWPLMGHFCLNL